MYKLLFVFIIIIIKNQNKKIENENKKKKDLNGGNYVIGCLIEWWRKNKKWKKDGSILQIREILGKKFENEKGKEWNEEEEQYAEEKKKGMVVLPISKIPICWWNVDITLPIQRRNDRDKWAIVEN